MIEPQAPPLVVVVAFESYSCRLMKNKMARNVSA
jgi:hypothetical protein